MTNTMNKPAVSFHFTASGSFLKNRTLLKEFLINLFKKEKKPLASLSYIFCSDEYLLDINRQYLKHDFYTDIITFELAADNNTEGEVYISTDRVKDNALQFGSTFQHELHRVIFHGALHLCGYKDKSKTDQVLMRKMEDKYLKSFFF